ncbi:MAG TPA: hypothetical protein VMR52_02515 [Dehalococcoidia bacterium]|nr:hypothetical protein [Dehalococcoidia bacterium]
MESVITGIAVGAMVGGASAWIGHWFERTKRREQRQEARDRNLREMIAVMMRLARAQSSGLREFKLGPDMLGLSVEEVRRNNLHYVLEIKEAYPNFFWRPNRIKDEELKRLASDLQSANSEASVLTFDRWKGGLLSEKEWEKSAERPPRESTTYSRSLTSDLTIWAGSGQS